MAKPDYESEDSTGKKTDVESGIPLTEVPLTHNTPPLVHNPAPLPDYRRPLTHSNTPPPPYNFRPSAPTRSQVQANQDNEELRRVAASLLRETTRFREKRRRDAAIYTVVAIVTIIIVIVVKLWAQNKSQSQNRHYG